MRSPRARVVHTAPRLRAEQHEWDAAMRHAWEEPLAAAPVLRSAAQGVRVAQERGSELRTAEGGTRGGAEVGARGGGEEDTKREAAGEGYPAAIPETVLELFRQRGETRGDGGSSSLEGGGAAERSINRAGGDTAYPPLAPSPEWPPKETARSDEPPPGSCTPDAPPTQERASPSGQRAGLGDTLGVRRGPAAAAHATGTPRTAPRSAPPRSVRELYDWRHVAASQQGVGVNGRAGTHFMGTPWDAHRWVQQRRMPNESLLLKSAQRAARSATAPAAYRTDDVTRASELTVGARTYQAHWRGLLAIERAHAAERLAQLRARPVDELVALGIALDALDGYWQTERHFGRRVAVFKLRGARRLPRHKLAPGTIVELVPHGARADWITPRTTAGAARVARLDPLCGAPPPRDAPVRVPAEVVAVGATQVRVRVAREYEHLPLDDYDAWRMDRGESDVVERRMDAALDALLYDTDELARSSSAARRPALAGTPLRDVLLPVPRDAAPCGLFAADCRIRSWYERYACAVPVRIDGDPELGLTATQLRAVAMMLRERVSLVQGPPGTGKTRTLVQTIALLKRHFQVPHPILLAAHTNVAVDNLVEGCAHAGLRVVRAGSATAARAALTEHTLEAHLARHAHARALQELDAVLKQLQERRAAQLAALGAARAAARAAAREAAREAARGAERVATRAPRPPRPPPAPEQAALLETRRRIRACIGRMHALRTRMYADVLHRADVVCSTAAAAGSAQLSLIDFPVVFVDEGSMATEPIALIPLMKGCAQLGLIGDHKQLPPVLNSGEARRQGLSRSLFERLMVGAVPSMMLDTQFRMHPTLAHFPNHAFYESALADAPGTAELVPYESAFAARDARGCALPLTMVTHAPVPASTASHGPGAASQGVSPYNAPQADLVLELLCDLLKRNAGLRGADIGVVTPYEAQVRLLQRMLAAGRPAPGGLGPVLDDAHAGLPLLSADAVDTLAAITPERAAQLAEIEVHTVDGFEGREKPVMVFSTVKAAGGSFRGTDMLYRALADGASAAALAAHTPMRGGFIGFLADTRRMNVALTRSQRQLFVVGNLDTLLSARLSERGEESVEKSDVHVVRAYARWLLSERFVVDVGAAREWSMGAAGRVERDISSGGAEA
ncbi:hypothetical protein MSPP1_002579 [Malassezia sp. CBS 17886]|nr:hypothetical protein MSPP1_002579 [Malassezia sp. CBS 17886]